MSNQGRLYVHSPLRDPAREIRLLDLFPGSFEDAIRVSLSHVIIKQQERRRRQQMPLEEIRSSLPPGWIVRVTIENEYLFQRSGSSGVEWQKDHPDPSIESSRYALQDDGDAKATESYTSIRYEALSYTWGSEEISDMAVIVDSSSNAIQVVAPNHSAALAYQYIPLQKNLALALRHLRNPSKPMRLWVDALCINQQDDQEKGFQVGRIGTIFQQAHRVIAYLGPEEHESRLALSTLKFLGEQLEVCKFTRKVRSPNAVEKTWYRNVCDLPYDEKTWNAIHHLLHRAWFSRLWVVQETLLANHRAILQCGYDTVLLSTFRRALICLQGKLWLPSAELRSQIVYARSMMDYIPTQPFSTTVRLGTNRHCTEPRDKVYGLLGLASPVLAAKIRPRYDISLEEAFKDIFLTYTEHVGRLDLLKYCSPAGREHEWPSWLPEFSAEGRANSQCAKQFASGYSRAHFVYKAPNILEIVGAKFAVISRVRGPIANSQDIQTAMSEIRRWLPSEAGCQVYPTGESANLAHAITLRMNRFKDRYSGMVRNFTLSQWLDEIGRFGICGPGPLLRSNEAKFAYSHVLQVLADRTYINTQEGYLGLAPPDTQQGDFVCVLLGYDNPLVLREREDGYFTIIGECFVYGLHDAIGLLGPIPEPWVVKQRKDHTGTMQFSFFNPHTAATTREDPRLKPDPKWERMHQPGEQDSLEYRAHFRNRETGDTTDSDPRLIPEALIERVPHLRTFSLK